jgi:hypothetical protein
MLIHPYYRPGPRFSFKTELYLFFFFEYLLESWVRYIPAGVKRSIRPLVNLGDFVPTLINELAAELVAQNIINETDGGLISSRYDEWLNEERKPSQAILDTIKKELPDAMLFVTIIPILTPDFDTQVLKRMEERSPLLEQ